jgi:hypothetical protein
MSKVINTWLKYKSSSDLNIKVIYILFNFLSLVVLNFVLIEYPEIRKRYAESPIPGKTTLETSEDDETRLETREEDETTLETSEKEKNTLETSEQDENYTRNE